MDDVLVPLCSYKGVNLVGAKGFQSLTGVKNLIRRAKTGKPAHILYISDFDPGGFKMPVAIARSCQYLLNWFGFDVDITIDPIMMTPDQVKQYNLPKVPIKEKDLAKKKFEMDHGAGGVELDALEAIYPGEFKKIVTQAIERYQDTGYWQTLADTEQEADGSLQSQWTDAVGEIEGEIEGISSEVASIYRRYQEPLKELAGELNAELEEVNAKLCDLHTQYIEVIDSFDPDLPDRPTAVADGPINQNPLYCSDRDYITQTELLRRHSKKGRTA